MSCHRWKILATLTGVLIAAGTGLAVGQTFGIWTVEESEGAVQLYGLAEQVLGGSTPDELVITCVTQGEDPFVAFSYGTAYIDYTARATAVQMWSYGNSPISLSMAVGQTMTGLLVFFSNLEEPGHYSNQLAAALELMNANQTVFTSHDGRTFTWNLTHFATAAAQFWSLCGLPQP